jgi:electron transport complex protein RnfC
MRRVLNARECLIGIEDNKPDAIAAMQAAIKEHHSAIEVVPVPTRYPMGGEKQLIYTLTGREVPRDGIPAQVGVVCHNPGTAYAVYKAVIEDEPLLSRIVTVTGGAVPRPSNYEVLLGTPMSALLQQSGVDLDHIDQLLMGGPMMGIPIDDPQAPVVKTCNCLLARSADERPPQRPILPCIRCADCADACPVSLLPQQLYWYARAKDLDKAQEYELFDCIECGVCSAVCPSNIPLVGYFRFAKTAIYTQEREKAAADLARERHEFRLMRIEREKHERQERLKKKKASVSGKGSVAAAKKKAVIEAAMARAKAKREAAEPKNTDNLNDAQLAQIKAADERRKAIAKD